MLPDAVPPIGIWPITGLQDHRVYQGNTFLGLGMIVRTNGTLKKNLEQISLFPLVLSSPFSISTIMIPGFSRVPFLVHSIMNISVHEKYFVTVLTYSVSNLELSNLHSCKQKSSISSTELPDHKDSGLWMLACPQVGADAQFRSKYFPEAHWVVYIETCYMDSFKTFFFLQV